MESDDLGFLVSMVFVWSFKIASLIVGYLLARLGYQLLVKGVSGDFKFSAQIKGIKADLVSVSPGLFFILMGTAIIVVSLYRGMWVNWPDVTAVHEFNPAVTDKPPLTPAPPHEEVK